MGSLITFYYLITALVFSCILGEQLPGFPVQKELPSPETRPHHSMLHYRKGAEGLPLGITDWRKVGIKLDRSVWKVWPRTKMMMDRLDYRGGSGDEEEGMSWRSDLDLEQKVQLG